jgi:hypothetical protein
MSYECFEYVYPHLNIHNTFTRSKASEGENRTEIAAKIASVNVPLARKLRSSKIFNFPHIHYGRIVTNPFVIFSSL